MSEASEVSEVSEVSEASEVSLMPIHSPTLSNVTLHIKIVCTLRDQ